jgi:hypothetical protein
VEPGYRVFPAQRLAVLRERFLPTRLRPISSRIDEGLELPVADFLLVQPESRNERWSHQPGSGHSACRGRVDPNHALRHAVVGLQREIEMPGTWTQSERDRIERSVY